MKLLQTFTVLSLLSLASLCFYGCEWNGSDDDNFVEIERPTTAIPLEVNLAGVNPNEVIWVLNGSQVYYSIHSGAHELIEQKYFLDGVELTEWNINADHYYVTVTGQPDDQIHELKIIMAFRTNTGSLAEIQGLEAYIGEFTFKIKIFENKENVLNIRQTVADGKYLKLVWDKPTDFEVDRYEVYEGSWHSETPVAIIHNPNETYFVDKTYAYGYRSYEVKAIPRNSIGMPYVINRWTAEYKNFTKEYVKTTLTADKLIIEWDNPNPFPAKYVVSFYMIDLLEEVEAEKSRIEIPRPQFPYSSESWFNAVYILPLDVPMKDYSSYASVEIEAKDKKVSEYPYWMHILDTKHHNIVGFTQSEYAGYNVFDAMSLKTQGELPNNIRIGNYFWEDRFSCSPQGKVAIEGEEYGGGNIHVFKDYDFSQTIYSFKGLTPDKFRISDSHLFYLKNEEQRLYSMDMQTQKIVDQEAYKESTTYNLQLELSPKGDYLLLYHYAHEDSWYTLYKVDNGQLKEIRHVRDRVRFALFNPENNAQLFLHEYDEQFKIVEVATGNTIRTIAKNRYLYTDPYTKNVLCYSSIDNSTEGLFSIYDETLTHLLYQVKAAVYFPEKGQFILANNMLYCGQNGIGTYYMDLSKALTNN